MRLGAHVSAAGGLVKSFDRAEDIGAETIQIFASSPRAWKFKVPLESDVSNFRTRLENVDVSPVYVHGSYLVNLAGNAELVKKSVSCLVETMNVSSQIGAAGVIFHLGSHGGIGFESVFGQVVKALKYVLSETDHGTSLIIENSAGMGNHIGSSFEEIGRLVNQVNDHRLNVCLDTEHAFAAGYDIVKEDGIKLVIKEFENKIGISKLAVVHANDSKVEFGSGVDRHQNIGEGYIGIEGFKTIMSHDAFREVPFILEVPGSDGSGPDKINMDRMKMIRNEIGI